MKITNDRSSGTSTLSAIRPYSALTSSIGVAISVSKVSPIAGAGSPLMIKGLSESNPPWNAIRKVPPFGASGLTNSRWVKSGPYFGSPISESACRVRTSACAGPASATAKASAAPAAIFKGMVVPRFLLNTGTPPN